MKRIFKGAVSITLIAVMLFAFSACTVQYAHNDVHTPYDDIKNLGKYIKLADYNVEVSKKELEQTKKDEIDAFLKDYAVENLVGDEKNGVPNRAIKKGDSVTIDTKIEVYREDGSLVPFDDLLDIPEDDKTTTSNLTGQLVENVGSGTYIKEIEDALIGAWTGDTQYVDVQYDDTVKTEQLKNQKVRITIDIKKVVEVIMPDYSDAFVESKTIYKTIAEFEAAMEKELLKAYTWNKYVAACKVRKFPKDRVKRFRDELNDYYTAIAQDKKQTLKQYLESNGSNIDEFNKQIQEQAEGTAKEELVLYFIAERKNLSFSEEKYQEYAGGLLEEYDCKTVSELEQLYTRELIERLLYWDLVKDFLYSEIKYVD